MGLFNVFSKNFLGIDIGISSIKLVELSSQKGKALTNYGILGADYYAQKSFQTRERGVLSVGENNIVQAITSIIKEAGIQSKEAFFAIPDYVSFFTTFDLPPMTEQEIPEAVKYEAPRRIPLPLSDVTLDWQIIKGAPDMQQHRPLRVLLVTVPNDVIEQYQRIAKKTGLKIMALEAEVFAIVRALVQYQDRSNIICLVDIGKRSTTINIVSQGILKLSYSFDLSGQNFTKILANTLSIEEGKAEAIKRSYGLSDKNEVVRKILEPKAKAILEKIKGVFNELYTKDKERVGKIIFTGGEVSMPGFIEYFSQNLDIPIEKANPFINISAPPTLQGILNNLGPNLTIATGMALRGLK